MTRCKDFLFFIFIFIFLYFITYFSFNYYLDNFISKINCSANVSFRSFKHNLKSNVDYTLSIGENNGWIKIKGKIIQGDNSYFINRKLYFNYYKNASFFVLDVNEITNSTDDNAPELLLTHFLPLAYVHEGFKMDMLIYPQTNNGYLITSSDYYSFYCQN